MKLNSLTESVIDVGSGLVLATSIQLLIFPFFGMYPTVLESFHIAVIFTVISFLTQHIARLIQQLSNYQMDKLKSQFGGEENPR